ncbi:signal peptide peptidase SppA [bacterium]|nr:signal peptide peptidase SppA [bacterium]
MSEKRDSGPIVLGMILLFFLLLCVITTIGFGSMSSKGLKSTSMEKWNSTGNIGLIKIEGAIFKSEVKVKNINKIAKLPNVKAIVLYINSPGGAIGPTEEIYRALMHAKEKGKKIYIVMGGLCASGGYFLASSGDYIFAENSTFTGSIGVIMQMANMTELYKYLKIKMITIKSGKYKDIGNSSRPMTTEDKNYLQDLITQSYNIFLDVVVQGRKQAIMDKFKDLKTDDAVKKYIKKYADGRVLLGKNAKELGFVDAIGDMEDAQKYIEKKLNLKIKFVKEPIKSKFMKIMTELGDSYSNLKSGKVEKLQLMYIM